MSKPSRRAARAAGGPAVPAGGQSGTSVTGRTPSTRAGRRERARTGYGRRSFFERHRGPIVGLAAVAAVGLVFAFLVLGATAKTYSCGRIWVPEPTPEPAPGQSPRLGYVQRDMGIGHDPGNPARYTLCPPASGAHLQAPGGPIPSRVYGPDDYAPPQGWVHNLEHGAIVVLYRGGDGSEAVTDAGQDALRELYRNFPDSPICNIPPGGQTPVIARFDDMAWPYAAIVWDRVLPLQTLDADLIYEFWRTEGERTNGEPQCAAPTPTPGPSGSATPSGSAAPSTSAAPSPSAS
ncbi:MAG: DUF3105 domain-containing protein [Chloroflexota bacterium]